jgi:2-polyprenyl-3-methyl-5-hydroxy-6-metoxy-1,4-benzoquinol methylase
MIPAAQPRSHVRFLSPPKKKARRSAFQRVTHVARGVRTVLRRRGVGYFGYLVTGYLWPALAYRLWFASGAEHPSLMMRALRLVTTRNGYQAIVTRHGHSSHAVPYDLTTAPAESPLWQEAERELNRLHGSGLTGITFDPPNVLLDAAAGVLTFAGVGNARLHRSTSSLCFRYWRDRDRIEFNRRFGRSLLTERSARERLAAQTEDLRRSTPYGGWYAGIDFGAGVTVDNFAGTNNGTGRWEYLNGPVVAPLVKGKRVLDLGSNNGVLAVMMLRAGAKEVVGLELSPWYARASHLVRDLFEWRDIKDYRLQVENRSMLDVLTEDWGQFDVVTAFCSLYCVEEEYMAQIVRKSAQLAPVMVLQANMPKPGMKAHHPRASAEFLRDLLVGNGFPSVEVFAPHGFARPILVGRATNAA